MASSTSQDDISVISKDLPELVALLTEFTTKISEVIPSVDNLQSRLDSGEIETEKGISFLEVKFHLLLEYIINLVYVMILKINGKPLNGTPAIERLTEVRTVLEKVRPIDQKLKYQVDKLIKIAVTGINSGVANPLSFKPNPGNMAAKREEEGSSDEETDKKSIYVPPRVSAVPYDDDNLESRKTKYDERAKMQSLNRSLLKDLREEYSETPEELTEDYRAFRGEKAKEKEMEQENYEEDNLIRLSRKKNDGRSKRDSGLRELTKFESFGFDDEDDGDKRETYGKRAKKAGGFSSKGKKKKFNFKSKKGKKFRK